MSRKTKQSGDARLDAPDEPSSEITIAEGGDVNLRIKDPYARTECNYRCSRAVLRSGSDYFDVLFDPAKFKEGMLVGDTLQELQKHYDGPIPASRLPLVTIADVGELPRTCSIHGVMKAFLGILHDPDTPWPVTRSQSAKSVQMIALLAIVADRFGSQACLAAYLERQMLITLRSKDRKSGTPYEHELENRQKLLAGMILWIPQWVSQCSSTLIMNGSVRGPDANTTSAEADNEGDDNALWWRLPGGVEEEIQYRRAYVLETLGSIQKHFIALYSSRQPQCKLGYGTSPACDSYQLGEMIRFFSRKGLLRIESALTTTPEEEQEDYSGNLEDIIARFKECPSYQVDNYHRHCGMRTRLMPILDSILPLNHLGIHMDCWKRDRVDESWVETPRRVKWTWRPRSRSAGGCQAHREAKAMYTAAIREWTPD